MAAARARKRTNPADSSRGERFEVLWKNARGEWERYGRATFKSRAGAQKSINRETEGWRVAGFKGRPEFRIEPVKGRSNPARSRARKVAAAPRMNPTIIRRNDGAPLLTHSLRKVVGRIPAGRWYPLRKGGEWNVSIRDAVRGQNFVYAVREAGSSSVLYVGEAHSARWKRPKIEYSEIEVDEHDDRGRARSICSLPTNARDRVRRARVPQEVELRNWKTLLHHFQDPEGKFAELGEWVGPRRGDLEVALWLIPAGRDYCDAQKRALRAEYSKTLRLRPLNTSIGFKRQEAPF